MTPLEILRKYWGYNSFRPLQEEIINSVIEGNDTLALMPTGGGKSLTFQVPGLYFENGITIVVTPLISLMKDQIDNLKKHKIKAVCFHSGMRLAELNNAWQHIFNGKVKFIYLSPERLQNQRFIGELRHVKVNLIVVDEAHCISQWGYDFRPAYLSIRELRKLKPGVPVLALTASATPEVTNDIMRQLDFKEGKLLKKSFSRDNISFIVRNSDTKIYEVLHILSNTSGSAIVYVRSRRRTKDISDFLNGAGISSEFYHAGLEFSQKEEKQNSWKTGKVRVMVATNAFGMGIDKPDVRTVIHYDLPPSLEEYYQEAGRAGRDGKTAYAVLLVHKEDKAMARRRLTESFPERKYIKNIYEKTCVFLHHSIGEGYDTVREFNIDKFCLVFKINEKQCRASLRLLSQAGYMTFIEDPDSRSRIKIIVDREELYHTNGLSENAEKVLSSILRLYPGLFSDFIYIKESEVAIHTGLQGKSVYEAFLELSRSKIISYIPFSGQPMIYMDTSREETGNLIIPVDIYEKRHEVMEKRIESMIDFAFASQGCRVSRMLEYFGEKDVEPCGKCDYCREKKKNKVKKPTDIAGEIMEFFRSRPDGVLPGVMERYLKIRSSELSPVLNFLINEGFIIFEDNLYKPAPD